MPIPLRRPDGTPIRDWRDWSPPKKSGHWKAGRSAMELARAWFTSPEPICPDEVRVLLETAPELVGLTLTLGIPEFVTRLPESGEGRNHDLLLEGHAEAGKVVIGVEAKADEDFGEVIGQYWTRMRAGREQVPPTPSKAPERIERLLLELAGASAKPWESPWKEVRYQLLTAAVGTLLETKTRGADLAVLVVHEFKTTETEPFKLEGNGADFAHFLGALGLCEPHLVEDGKLYGPTISQDGLPPLLVGKAVCDWNPNSI